MARRLIELLSPLGLTCPSPEVVERPVTGATHDSRLVQPGYLFFALRGRHVDGHTFVGAARQAGALAAVVEQVVDDPLPQIHVPDVTTVMAPLAAAAFDYPSRALRVHAFTGSNGKTTGTWISEAIGKAVGERVGVIGTIEYRWGGQVLTAHNTTPVAPDVQRLLAAMRDDGVTWVAMEASSHAIVEHRVDSVRFAGMVFTNLSPEHLDYHKTLENYREAKARLFLELADDDTVMAINADDAAGQNIAGRIRKGRVVRYAVDAPAEYSAIDLELHADGVAFMVQHPNGSFAIRSNLLGRHNVYNLLGVIALHHAQGIDVEAIIAGVGGLKHVPGRLEEVSTDLGFTVIVDYAHTPDGLRQVLRTVQELPHSRIITVFGCGGDRDRTKRAPMGQIAETYSDVVIVTSDNPRTEDPKAIIDQILAGMARTDIERHVVVDRATAIELAVQSAQVGDIVLVAGKGHETYQEFAHGRIDFDDRVVARRAVEARR